MGRKPIGKLAMTAAQRQRKRRRKLKGKRSAELRAKDAARRREKMLEGYIPSPPGITYWKHVEIRPEHVGRQICQPATRPLASCQNELSNEDVIALIQRLYRQCQRRGIPIPDPAVKVPFADTSMGFSVEEPHPGREETATRLFGML